MAPVADVHSEYLRSARLPSGSSPCWGSIRTGSLQPLCNILMSIGKTILCLQEAEWGPFPCVYDLSIHSFTYPQSLLEHLLWASQTWEKWRSCSQEACSPDGELMHNQERPVYSGGHGGRGARGGFHSMAEAHNSFSVHWTKEFLALPSWEPTLSPAGPHLFS